MQELKETPRQWDDAASQRVKSNGQGNQPVDVLIVDDEDQGRRMMTRLLEKHGYSCEPAADAAEARRSLAERAFSLALVDVWLPDESGIDLIEHIRSKCPATAALVVTGLEDPELAQIALQSGADGYLSKPFRPTQLVIAAMSALHRKAADVEAARRSQQVIRAVFEGSLDAMVIADDSGIHIDANTAACDLFGVARDQLIGSRFSQFSEPGFDLGRAWRTPEEGGRPVLATRLIRRDGTIRDVEISASANFIHGRHLAVIRDITKRTHTNWRLEAEVAVAQILESAFTVADAVTAAIEVVCRGFDFQFGALWEIDEQNNVLRLSESWQEAGEPLAEFEAVSKRSTFARRIGLPGKVWERGAPAWLESVRTDVKMARSAVASRAGLKSGFAVPMATGPEVTGVLEFFTTRTDRPDDELVSTMGVLGKQLGQFVERRRAEARLRQTEAKLEAADEARRELLSRLVVAHEEERRQISEDIHDDPIQVMAAVNLQLEIMELTADTEQLKRISEVREAVVQSIDHLRHLVFELSPPVLEREGLARAITTYLEEAGGETGWEYKVHDLLPSEPPTEIRLLAYRIVQEALSNARKHARARHVDVRLQLQAGGLLVRVSDDGRGFDVKAARAARPGHLGVPSIYERAESAGGWCRVLSRPGAGATVECWFPIARLAG
jgi:PAS domain S-box-containing protein